MGDGAALSVHGGAGGTSVSLAALEAAGQRLRSSSVDVAETVGALWWPTSGALADPRLLARALVDDPGSVPGLVARLAHLQGRVARAVGPSGALGESGELVALGLLVTAAAQGYRATEQAVERSFDAVSDAAMFAVGAQLPMLAAAALHAHVDGHDLLAESDVTTFESPWLVELAARGLDGFLLGVASLDPGIVFALEVACAREGRLWPPRDDAEAVGVVAAAGALLGAFDEGALAEPTVQEVAVVEGAGGLASISDLVAGPKGLRREPDRIRVTEIPQVDGSATWVVQVPGTQAWSPRAGDDPFDLTSDVRLMAGEATGATVAVRLALEQAQRDSRRRAPDHRGESLRPPEPVVLVGHSQGGIVAAALASDPEFTARHEVTDVVAFGAPIARFPIPSSTRVLALEHRQDPVTHLDGRANPDRPHWTTVVADTTAVDATVATGSAAHARELYVRSAALVDRVPPGVEPSIDAWRTETRALLSGSDPSGVVVRDYTATRGWQNPGP